MKDGVYNVHVLVIYEYHRIGQILLSDQYCVAPFNEVVREIAVELILGQVPSS